MITPLRDLSLFQQLFGKGKRSILTSVQRFGEICMMTYHDNSHQTKLANKGTQGIWVGLADGHSVSTYSMFNPKAPKLAQKNVTFLFKSHDEWNKVEKPTLVFISYEG